MSSPYQIAAWRTIIGAVLALPLGLGLANPVEGDRQLSNEWEQEYRQRVEHVLALATAKKAAKASTFFENEKRSYGLAMLQLLAGNDEALEVLQAEDAQGGSWHRETARIDYYACFTLKHQMRKYFYFGDRLDPAYRQRMYDGGRAWTEQDPLRRPHHSFNPEKENKGWGPDARNSWVDVRSTDNLFLMRTTSVYLMAEETGNEPVRKLYADRFATFVKSVYRIGNGEWDSENYLGHSIAPVHNMYDFAKDPEVKAQARALLDWFYAAAAFKYFRGGHTGPSKRDYTHIQPFGGSMASLTWLYFGDSVSMKPELETDEIHLITSTYRPPLAVIDLARKNFARPREILSAKPEFEAPQRGNLDVPPAYHETVFVGTSFQFGSIAEGMSDKGDVSAFRVVLADDTRGLADIQCAPYLEPGRVGSPRYGEGFVSAANRTAQFRNLGLWMIEDSSSPWMWVLPKTVRIEVVDDVTFLVTDQTWIALHPINTNPIAADQALTSSVATRKDADRRPGWGEYQVLSTAGTGNKRFCGFAMEIGNADSHESFEAFKTASLEGPRFDNLDIDNGNIVYRGTTGDTIGMEFSSNFPDYRVIRNGTLHDWARDHAAVYREVGTTGDHGLLHQPWNGDGTLRIDTGRSRFECTVGANGSVSE